jgi:sugar/nucleoside kinase (ribokinase family)
MTAGSAARITLIGNVNVDLIARPVDALPPPGAEWQVEHMDVRTGGAAANAALALARLGGRPRLVGCVGDDGLGDVTMASLVAGGVSTADVTSLPGASTGVSIAFEAPDRDRSFLISLGALSAFDASMIPAEALRADLVLLCGYFNLPALRGAATERLLERARAGGARTCLDPGWDPAGWTAATRDELASLLPLVHVLLPNEIEAARMSGEEAAEDAARTLQRASGGWVVVKLGRRGCLARGPDDAALRAGAPSVDVVDTTGAGDAFNAGYLWSLAEGVDAARAMQFATRVASAVVARPSHDRYPSPADLAAS